PQPGEQPEGGKAGRGGQGDRIRIRRAERIDRVPELFQPGVGTPEESTPLGGELQAAMAPLEQRTAQGLLERADLPAQRRLGDGQLPSSGGHVHAPAPGHEGSEELERGEAEQAPVRSRSAWEPGRDGPGALSGRPVRGRSMTTSIAEFGREGRPRIPRGWERARSRDVAVPRVEASLSYLARAPGRPVAYLFDPPAGTPRDNAEYDARIPPIRDARLMASSLSVHRNGFELWDAPSAVGNFRDDAEVVDHYYSEAAELALAATGGTEAHVFDHLVRQREAGRPVMTLGARRGSHLAGPAGRAHNDYSEASGARRFGLVLPDRPPGGRFCIVNLWRSIGEVPVLDTPLAFCDARSVEPGDLVPGEIRYPRRGGEIYLLRFGAGQAWSYFSGMERDEVVVFKQYDSDRNQLARFTPHAAFDHPAMPPHGPPRTSIE